MQPGTLPRPFYCVERVRKGADITSGAGPWSIRGVAFPRLGVGTMQLTVDKV